jgi:hypothetical protein
MAKPLAGHNDDRLVVTQLLATLKVFAYPPIQEQYRHIMIFISMSDPSSICAPQLSEAYFGGRFLLKSVDAGAASWIPPECHLRLHVRLGDRSNI